MSVYRSGVSGDDFEPETRDFYRGRSVCVTGGSGFIGSHVVEQLVELGAHPVVSSRQAEPPFLAHLGGAIEIRRGDLAEPGVAEAAVAGTSSVLNLAASVGGIGYNAAHPATVFQANMRGFLNIIEAASKAGVERFLVTSSACIYPSVCTVPTPETESLTDGPEPTNAGYGWAKRMEEYLGRAYAEERGLKVAIARPYNAYGPRDNFNPESSHVLPALILKAFESTDGVLPVWGDGSPTRSFLYADDFARGLLEITARYAEAEPLNIGGEGEISIAEVAHLVARMVGEIRGQTITPSFTPNDLAGTPRRSCDTTKLNQALGFAPMVTFERGLRNQIDWLVANRALALTAHTQ